MDKPSYDLYVDDKSQNTNTYFESCSECSKRVEKGWGHETIIVNNAKYCGKILHFKKHARFSMHFHMKKTETWYVYSGKFEFLWIDTKTAEQSSRLLHVGDIVTNEIGQPHQLVCLEEGDIFEVSTQHFDSDSYRIGKGDSQHTYRFEQLVLLMHLGLGDQIIMAPAVAAIAKQAQTVYIPCKSEFIPTINSVYAGLGNIVLLPITNITNDAILNIEIHKHIEEISKKGSVVVAGTGCFSKRPNPIYPFPSGFYKDIGLDFNECKRIFSVNVPNTYAYLLTILKQLAIPHIFVHSASSTKHGSDIDTYVHSIKTKYGTECILLNPDTNMYPPNHHYYYLAQLAVRTLQTVITDYILLMESAYEIHIIDSCYFSLSAFLNTENVKEKVVYKRANNAYVWLDSDTSWKQVLL
jgi:quercetin dioxygenase-like cupin family protein